MLDPNGYTMKKRRAFRRARREALKAGFRLSRFQPGHDEPKDLPEQFIAIDRHGAGWAMVCSRDGAEEWAVYVRRS